MTDTLATPTPRGRAAKARQAAEGAPGRKTRRAKAASRSVPPLSGEGEAAAVKLTKSPRTGSQLAGIVALLQRPEGATVDAMVAATGWQRHSVRGALAGALKKTYGLTITSAPAEGGRVYRLGAAEAEA